MATHTMNTMMTTSQMVGALVMKPLQSFFNALVHIGERSVHARLVTELSAMSDEELAARGTTRADMVQKIFRSHI